MERTQNCRHVSYVFDDPRFNWWSSRKQPTTLQSINMYVFVPDFSEKMREISDLFDTLNYSTTIYGDETRSNQKYLDRPLRAVVEIAIRKWIRFAARLPNRRTLAVPPSLRIFFVWVFMVRLHFGSLSLAFLPLSACACAWISLLVLWFYWLPYSCALYACVWCYSSSIFSLFSLSVGFTFLLLCLHYQPILSKRST